MFHCTQKLLAEIPDPLIHASASGESWRANVLLCGLMFPDDVPGRVVAAWRQVRFELAISVPQLAVIGRALAYPKIRRVLGWDDQRIEQFIRQIYIRAQIVDLAGTTVQVPGDLEE